MKKKMKKSDKAWEKNRQKKIINRYRNKKKIAGRKESQRKRDNLKERERQ